MDLSIVIIGTGRLGTHLVDRLWKQGASIVQLVNRSANKVLPLAEQYNIPFTTTLDDIHTDADIYLLSVPDDALPHVAQRLHDQIPYDSTICHFSGNASLNIITNYHAHAVVLWPIYSFANGIVINWEEMFVAYDFNSPNAQVAQMRLLELLNCKHFYANTDSKKALHLAAVFGSNFSTALYSIAYQICDQLDLPFESLIPLLAQNNLKLKASEEDPFLKITGPAIRKDEQTIKDHLAILDKGLQKEIYILITAFIQNRGEHL